jgi:hypothetical protein
LIRATPRTGRRLRPGTPPHSGPVSTHLVGKWHGTAVKIDTVSHQGLLGKEDAAPFFASAGIPKDQVDGAPSGVGQHVFGMRTSAAGENIGLANLLGNSLAFRKDPPVAYPLQIPELIT